ncbi:hypothetical protein I4F81_001744 [Pyropia yezoensis]|uniref:Uncharacterized protein n=1 Tax=Pyropia yezoensis TaxID=2788 RepID=A0ACC3BMT8_PYRYE|nr:hypothetical protein I4F81_001744 [Neopyropia yezoensis]
MSRGGAAFATAGTLLPCGPRSAVAPSPGGATALPFPTAQRLPRAGGRRRVRAPSPTCAAADPPDGDGWRFGIFRAADGGGGGGGGGDGGADGWVPLDDARLPLARLPALPPAGVSAEARLAAAAADVRFKGLADGGGAATGAAGGDEQDGAAAAAPPAGAPARVVASAYEEDVRRLVVCAAGTSLLYASVVQAVKERRRLWLRPLAVLVLDATTTGVPPPGGGDAAALGWAADAGAGAGTTLHDVRGGADMLVDDAGWGTVDTVTRAVVTASLAARPRPFFSAYVEGVGGEGEAAAAERALQDVVRKLGQQM